MNAAFRRYRVMSFVTGTTLLILFVTLALHQVDLSFWLRIKWFVDIVGVGHGIVLYPIYMIMSFNFVLKAKLPVLWIAGMFLAGFVPFVAFILEHYMQRRFYPNGEFRAP